MRFGFPSALVRLSSIPVSRPRLRGVGAASAFLLVFGAIGSVPVAEAQDFGPNFAHACGDSLIVVQGVRPSEDGTSMVLTDGGKNETSSVYCPISSPILDGSFATAFTFQITDPRADGFTLAVISEYGFETDSGAPDLKYSLGGLGGGLGYKGIPMSVALKFDLYDNAGEGSNSTGLFTNGAAPTVPAINLTGTGIDLHSGHPIAALVSYDGTYKVNALTLTLTDTVTKAAWSHRFTVDIVSLVGVSQSEEAPYIYGLGFTAATGGLTSTQEILKWNTATIYHPTLVGLYDYVGGTEGGNAYPTAPLGTTPLNGAGSPLTLTDGGYNEGNSFFHPKAVDVEKFDTDFTFQISNAFAGARGETIYYTPPLKGGQADGFTFAILGPKPGANPAPAGVVGSQAGGLGYHGIKKSAAIKFDLFDNEGEGPDSTGLYVNGAYPSVPSVNLAGSGIDLHSPDILDARITYDGTTLNLTLTDTVTGAKFSHGFPIDIPSTIGSPTGYVGFTAATGGSRSSIQVLTWTYWEGITDPVLEQ